MTVTSVPPHECEVKMSKLYFTLACAYLKPTWYLDSYAESENVWCRKTIILAPSSEMCRRRSRFSNYNFNVPKASPFFREAVRVKLQQSWRSRTLSNRRRKRYFFSSFWWIGDRVLSTVNAMLSAFVNTRGQHSKLWVEDVEGVMATWLVPSQKRKKWMRTSASYEVGCRRRKNERVKRENWNT